MTMFDVKAIEAEARKEVAKERADAAKKRLKAALEAVANAERILANARLGYDAVLKEIGAQQ
jgi:hypothetical protein